MSNLTGQLISPISNGREAEHSSGSCSDRLTPLPSQSFMKMPAAVFSDSSKSEKLPGCTYIHFCNIIYSEKSVRKTDQVCFIFCIDSHEIS